MTFADLVDSPIRFEIKKMPLNQSYTFKKYFPIVTSLFEIFETYYVMVRKGIFTIIRLILRSFLMDFCDGRINKIENEFFFHCLRFIVTLHYWLR
jgi:hypothetical protein